jgi:hypothetical protein
MSFPRLRFIDDAHTYRHILSGTATSFDDFLTRRTSVRVFGDYDKKKRVKGRFNPTPALDQRVWADVQLQPFWYGWGGTRYVYSSTTPFYLDAELYWGYGVSHLTTSIQTLATQATDAFLNQAPEEISLGNFLIEWKEAVRLIPNLVEGFARLGSKARYARHRGKPPASSVSEDASDYFLWWNFAVAPLIADLTAFASLVQKTQARLEWIRQHNGKRIRVKFRRNNLYLGIPAFPPEYGVPLNGPSDPSPPWGALSAKATLRKVHADFSSQAWLSIKIPEKELDGMVGFCRTLLGTTGLNNPLGIIWNAIPFSFILDWVVDFSGLLARRRVNPFTGSWELDEMTWSLKSQSVWDVSVTYAEEPWAGVVPHLIGQIYDTVYERGIGFPESELSTLIKGGITPKQGALLVALLR